MTIWSQMTEFRPPPLTDKLPRKFPHSAARGAADNASELSRRQGFGDWPPRLRSHPSNVEAATASCLSSKLGQAVQENGQPVPKNGQHVLERGTQSEKSKRLQPAKEEERLGKEVLNNPHRLYR